MKFCVKCGAIMRSTSAGIYVCPSCGNIQKDVPAEKPKTDPGVDKSAKSAKPAADKPEARKTPSAPVKKDRPASPTAANTPAAAPAAKAGRAYSLNTDIGAEKEDKAQENIESGDENPEKEKQGVIFDGFPRTTEQAKALKEMLARRGSKVDIVIGLDVPESELIDRLIKRGKESGRSDDNLETIKKRLDVYHSQTSPLRDHYVAEGIYAAINGLGSIEGIFEDIKKAIDNCRK